MPKPNRVDDALAINDENDRIIELCFSAKPSAEFMNSCNPSNYIFVTNISGQQEERRTLGSCLDTQTQTSNSELMQVCCYRRKFTITLPALEAIMNNTTPHTFALYARPTIDVGEGSNNNNNNNISKPVKQGGKRERAKREEDIFPIEDAEQLLFESFDLVDLLARPSFAFSIPVSSDFMFQNCTVEVRCGTAFLPPNKLNKYRPMNIEFHSILNLPESTVPDDPLFISVNFGDIKFKSPKINLEKKDKVIFRHVVFFGYRTPLQVYQNFFFKKMEISVFRGNEICIGSGNVSLRLAATDHQIELSETVYLLPNRATLSLDENCLTKSAIVSLRLDLFIPLPFLSHVLPDGQPVNGQFLTRGIIRMPYFTKWTSIVLETFISTILQFKRAYQGSDVYQYELPLPEREPTPPKEKKERQKTNKGQITPPLRPVSPISAFESPFKIITPPGISGFEVMDENIRIICIEGPAVEIHYIFEKISAAANHNPELILLMNAELFVPKRDYIIFPSLVTIPRLMNSITPIKENNRGNPSEEMGTPINHGIHSNIVRESPKNIITDVSSTLSISKETANNNNNNNNNNNSNNNKEEIFDSAEAEAGGTGGRIHRIRIKETIESLMSQQRYLLKRILSEDCVSCYTKLYNLCQCHSLREIIERNLFPTSEELIALERSFGVTLELSDIFGKQEFVSVTMEKEINNDIFSQKNEEKSLPGININSLNWNDIGKMALFVATRVMSSKKKIPSCVEKRYSNVYWMQTVDTKKYVLCAFPSKATQPSGTIRYFIEAQVIRCDQIICLYALECNSLSKSCTDSRNLAYETYLVNSKRGKNFLATQSKSKEISKFTFTPARQGVPRIENSDSSGDDENVDSPPYEEIPINNENFITTRKENFILKNRKNISLLTKQIPKMTASDYEYCWELYHQRDPVLQVSSSKKPPMKF